MASERTSSLDTCFDELVWERGEQTDKKRKDFRERESTFSLGFPMIRLSNPGETRGKVDPHCKSYTWVPVLWSFRNFER